MKINVLLLFTILGVLTSFGQSDYGRYDKSTYEYQLPDSFDPSIYEGDIQNVDSSMVMLDRYITAFQYVSSEKVFISHKIYYVGNSSDIEKINRLYLYAGSSTDDIYVNVRTTTKDGRTIRLDASKMEDVSKDDGSANYKILAISGIEEHSWVEVLVIENRASVSRRISIDNPFFTKKAEVYMHGCRKYYKSRRTYIRFRGYGKFKRATWLEKTENQILEEEERTVDLESDNDSLLIKPILTATDVMVHRNENYSFDYENYTYADITSSMYSWEEAGKGIGLSILNTDRGANIDGRKWLRKLDADDLTPTETLKVIEKFLKNDIVKIESSDADYSQTSKVWNNRIANERGLVKIADQILNVTDLKYKVYLCSDKDYIQIDKDFAFTRGLNDILFYFPDLEMYMVPSNGYYYSGEIPHYLASSLALVIKDNTTDSQTGEVVRLIDARKEHNMDGTRSIITIDELEEKVTVKKTKMFYGDRATVSRGYYHFSDEDERKEYIEELLIDDTEMSLSAIEIKNESIDLNFQSTDTVLYSGTLTGSGILSSIPNGFILNPGGIMGTQVSFYDTENRISDIHLPESKVYEHTIIIEIPEGYKAEGTDNLAFDEKYVAAKRWLYGETEEDADTTDADLPRAQFVSEVKVSDSQVRVDIYEYYEEGFYPKDGIEDLQKVVNAAYEFFIAKIKLVKE